MSYPLVSIIIPCWNGQHFVAEAIDSALAQTYPHVEVIVIDDGSTDGTAGVLRSFGERIRWETTPNRGGGAARNRGVELSRGELVQFLDADDLLYPNKLLRMVPPTLKGGPHSMALCGWETAPSPTSKSRTSTRLEYNGEDPFVFFTQKITLISSPLHWKRRIESVGGFTVGLRCCQEYDLHLKLAADSPSLLPVPEPLWLQRRTVGSVSSDMHKVLLTFETVLLSHEHIVSRQDEKSRKRAQAMAEELVKCSRLLVRHNDPAAAGRLVAHARRIDPVTHGLNSFARPESRALARTVGPVRAEAIIQRAVKMARHFPWLASHRGQHK